MSGSYRLQKKEIRDSRKLFQPPQLANSNLLSSHDRSEFHQERIHQLSNVQEKSYFWSENEANDKEDIQEFIANIKTTEPYNEPFSPTSRKQNPSMIRRIEDQNIIVVEEQNEIGSNSGGKQSVILQHIDFNQQEKQPQQTPEWESHQNNYKHQGVNYTINYVQAPHNFLVQENQNASSETPYDLSTSELKNNKVRNSKNTCIQHNDLRDSSHVKNIKEINKSCIAPPVNRANSKGSSSPQSSKQLDINQILSKWNNYIYPELSEEYLRKDTVQQQERRRTISYNVPLKARQCISNYQNQASRLQLEEFSQLKYTNKGKEEKETQTESLYIELKIKQSNQKIKNLEEKLKKVEEQNLRLLSNEKKKQEELAFLRENLSQKSQEIQNLRSTLQQTNQSRNRLWIDESKRMQSKNKQLQKIINDQNLTIRVFEEKHGVLQKKLHQTVSYLQKSVQMQQPPQSKSMRMQRFDTFGYENHKSSLQNNNHEDCNSKIQALQQYIFDMEQQRVGIDLEVQKRLKKAIQKMESQIRKNTNEEFKMILSNLKQENSKLRQINIQMDIQRKELIEQCQQKQVQIEQRENKVKKMYDQVVSQWNQLQKIKQRSFQKKNTSPSSSNPILLPSSRSGNLFDPLFSKSQANELYAKLETPLKNNYLSNRNLLSPSNHKLALNAATGFDRDSSIQYFKQYESLPPSLRSNLTVENPVAFERMTFGRQNRGKSKELDQNFQNSDLYLINSKIQRLRSEINRELDLIN